MITVRKSTPADLDALMEIIEEARRTIAALGINQWQDGNPSRQRIAQDIQEGASYLVESDGEICGTFALFPANDPTYVKIYEGNWRTEGPYVAMHRVAIALRHRGKGIAEKMMGFAADFAKERGFFTLRIDTHEGNKVMRRMLEKNGFSYCGVIYLLNGDPRVAYDKIL